MKDGLDIVLTDLDRDFQEQHSRVQSDIEDAQSVSDRLDRLEEQMDQITERLPDKALDQQGTDSSGDEISIDKRLPFYKINGKRVNTSKSWDEIRREAEERLRDRGVNLSDASVDDVLDEETCQRIEERYSGDFRLHADLDRYDVWAAVAAGTVAALVDFFIVKIPQDHLYKGEYSQEGSPLTKWLQSKDDPDQHWLAGLAQRLEEDNKTSFDAVGPIMENDLVEGFHPRTHRLQTFGHDPLLGLVIGTIDVMRGGMTAISRDGIPMLLGGDDVPGGLRPPVANIFKAFGTTVLHMLSDATTEMGIQPPGFTLLQAFDVQAPLNDERTVGELARFMYLKGYDSRHFLTMSTSVAAAEVVLRGYYFLRRHFDEGYDAEVCYTAEVAGEKSWRFNRHPRFMGMKLTAHTIGAAMNAGKVAIHQGNPLAVNYTQWLSFARDAVRFAGLKTQKPGEVVRGHVYANARRLEEGWDDIDVSHPDFPDLVVRA